MKPTTNWRELLGPAAIAIGACVGAWMLLAKPKVDELAKIEQAMAEQKAAAGSMSGQTVEAAAKRMTDIRTRVAEIQTFNELAGDTSRLYGLVMDLADVSHVQVKSLQPGIAKTSATDASVTTTRLSMNVEGPYENVAQFIDSVCSLPTFIRPVNLNLLPTRQPGRAVVEANFECDVINFALPAALADLGGTNHATP